MTIDWLAPVGIWVLFSLLVGLFANKRGRSGVGFFILSLVISPPITALLVALFEPGKKTT